LACFAEVALNERIEQSVREGVGPVGRSLDLHAAEVIFHRGFGSAHPSQSDSVRQGTPQFRAASLTTNRWSRRCGKSLHGKGVLDWESADRSPLVTRRPQGLRRTTGKPPAHDSTPGASVFSSYRRISRRLRFQRPCGLGLTWKKPRADARGVWSEKENGHSMNQAIPGAKFAYSGIGFGYRRACRRGGDRGHRIEECVGRRIMATGWA